MSKRLFVGQLSRETGEQQLLDMFSRYGRVESVQILRDKHNASKCAGFVTMSTVDEARKAIGGLHNKIILRPAARPIQVTFAKGSCAADTIFVGSLPPYTSKEDVTYLFRACGSISEVTPLPKLSASGDCCFFIKFAEVDGAQAALAFNGNTPPGSQRPIEVRFAEQKPEITPPETMPSSHTSAVKLFVGQLPFTYTENDLFNLFSHHGQIIGIQILRTPDGTSKGAGFVVFARQEDADSAIDALHEKLCLRPAAHPIQIRHAGISVCSQQTLFVGSLPANVSHLEILTRFSEMGPIDSVTMLQSRSSSGDRCVLVKFLDSSSAQAALVLNGQCLRPGTRPMEVRYAEKPSASRRHSLESLESGHSIESVGQSICSDREEVNSPSKADIDKCDLNTRRRQLSTSTVASDTASFYSYTTCVNTPTYSHSPYAFPVPQYSTDSSMIISPECSSTEGSPMSDECRRSSSRHLVFA